MNRLKDKVVIVTGGNSGVGAAAAKLLAAEGAKVVITARRAAALEAVAKEIEAAGGTVLAVPTDISKPGDAENLVEKTMEKFGKIDVLVNNAGILEEGLKPIDRYTDEDLDRILETNTKGTMRCMRAVSQKMQPGASIVNVASVAGALGCGGAAYVASKSAVIGVTRHTALRFQATGIRCNAICPGTIVTPMVADMQADKLDPDMFGAMATHSNLKTQPCMPEDVANIILFFASDESRAITGQVLVTDFGSML
ncbi:MAG: SDR family NAD(P)-dependent oxidoreductase [Lachnospiraceae bacterium]|jgi:NAD(P)-dependent dehydrogenase (short-subunit alcohol dehydrogenase family)|nr:SDR family oxidoreductase [Lachnospiraceae bacterium]MCX4346492.1 SDR family NAD(P)-dependent oxidoreductase [Lachnospiraceae bacterium]